MDYPCRITYGNGMELRFHGVVEESHQATSEITKYPIQQGFVVSNHAIRKNRKLSIDGMFTNVPIGRDSYDFAGIGESSNNIRTAFSILKDLVRNAVVCKVETNLGTYNDVVFTGFNTKSASARIDSMDVKLSGEELQIISARNKTRPRELQWQIASPEENDSLLQILENYTGIKHKRGTAVETASFTIGEDYSFKAKDRLGNVHWHSYIFDGFDAEKKPIYKHYIHVEKPEPYLPATDPLGTMNMFGVGDPSVAFEWLDPLGDGDPGFNTTWAESKELYNSAKWEATQFSKCLFHAGKAKALELATDAFLSWWGPVYKDILGVLKRISTFDDGPLSEVAGACIIARLEETAAWKKGEELIDDTNPSNIRRKSRAKAREYNRHGIEHAKNTSGDAKEVRLIKTAEDYAFENWVDRQNLSALPPITST